MEKVVLHYSPEEGELYADGLSSTLDQRDCESIEQKELENIIGPVAKPIMYSAAKILTSTSMASYFRRLLDNKTEPEDMLKDIMSFLQRRGMGIFECVKHDLKNGSFTIRVRYSFNTMAYSESKKPICYTLSGILAGILEPIVRVSLDCEETSCSAMGQEYCEFKVKPSKRNTFPKKYFNVKPPEEVKGLTPLEVDYDKERGLFVFEGSDSFLNFRAHDSLYQKEFEKTIGPAARGIIYSVAGKYSATSSMGKAKRLIIRLIGGISIESLANEFAKRIPMRGYGVLENLKIDSKNKEITFDIRNSYNTIAYGKTKEPICYCLSGVIAGATSLLFNKDSECIELKCRSMGNKACTFKSFARKEEEDLNKALIELDRIPEIQRSMIVSNEGMIRASTLPDEAEPNKIASRVGILLGAGQKVSEEFKLGKFGCVNVFSSGGFIMSVRINPRFFLSVLVRQGANKGMVDFALDKARKRIAMIL